MHRSTAYGVLHAQKKGRKRLGVQRSGSRLKCDIVVVLARHRAAQLHAAMKKRASRGAAFDSLETVVRRCEESLGSKLFAALQTEQATQTLLSVGAELIVGDSSATIEFKLLPQVVDVAASATSTTAKGAKTDLSTDDLSPLQFHAAVAEASKRVHLDKVGKKGRGLSMRLPTHIRLTRGLCL